MHWGSSTRSSALRPRGIWQALSPWGPVGPAERFGTPAEPVPSALARVRHRHRPPDHSLHPPAQAAGRARHLHRHPAEPEGGGQDRGPVLGAGARHAARPQRDHDADGAAQLHRRGAWRELRATHAGRYRGAAEPARRRAARRAQRRLSLYAGRAGAAGAALQSLGASGCGADDHAVAAHAGRRSPRSFARRRRAAAPVLGRRGRQSLSRSSWRMPMPSSSRRTPST